ncbi:hypothetical protein DFAR_570002 [Desulfarculales bacterium]
MHAPLPWDLQSARPYSTAEHLKLRHNNQINHLGPLDIMQNKRDGNPSARAPTPRSSGLHAAERERSAPAESV